MFKNVKYNHLRTSNKTLCSMNIMFMEHNSKYNPPGLQRISRLHSVNDCGLDGGCGAMATEDVLHHGTDVGG